MDLIEIGKTFGAWAAGAFAAGWLAWFLLKEYIKARDAAQQALMEAMNKRIDALERVAADAIQKHEQALIYQRDELAEIAKAGHNRERILVEMYRQQYQPHPAPAPEPPTAVHRGLADPREADTEQILQPDQRRHRPG